jgi:hypothetical protein
MTNIAKYCVKSFLLVLVENTWLSRKRSQAQNPDTTIRVQEGK